MCNNTLQLTLRWGITLRRLAALQRWQTTVYCVAQLAGAGQWSRAMSTLLPAKGSFKHQVRAEAARVCSATCPVKFQAFQALVFGICFLLHSQVGHCVCAHTHAGYCSVLPPQVVTFVAHMHASMSVWCSPVRCQSPASSAQQVREAGTARASCAPLVCCVSGSHSIALDCHIRSPLLNKQVFLVLSKQLCVSLMLHWRHRWLCMLVC